MMGRIGHRVKGGEGVMERRRKEGGREGRGGGKRVSVGGGKGRERVGVSGKVRGEAGKKEEENQNVADVLRGKYIKTRDYSAMAKKTPSTCIHLNPLTSTSPLVLTP